VELPTQLSVNEKAALNVEVQLGDHQKTNGGQFFSVDHDAVTEALATDPASERVSLARVSALSTPRSQTQFQYPPPPPQIPMRWRGYEHGRMASLMKREHPMVTQRQQLSAIFFRRRRRGERFGMFCASRVLNVSYNWV
jgi:hypothetical protein